MIFPRFLQDADAHDDGEHAGESKPWGEVIAASLLIQMATFSGLLLMGFVSGFQKLNKTSPTRNQSFWYCFHHQILPAFASGALLATAVFLLIPESFELFEGVLGSEEAHTEHERRLRRSLQSNETITSEHDEESNTESQVAWRVGTSLLGGFIIPIMLGIFFPQHEESDLDGAQILESQRPLASNESKPLASNELEGSEQPLVSNKSEGSELDVDADFSNTENIRKSLNLDQDADGSIHGHAGKQEYKTSSEGENTANARKSESVDVASKLPRPINLRLAATITIGDFCHNFCDGIFLGTAFLLCSNSIAWTITFTTIYHEIAQEIADFFLLTNHCGLSTPQALVANFLAGCSVMLGGLIVLGFTLTDSAVGSILGISAGVYIYIAASECIPRIQASRRQRSDTLVFLVCFVSGAVPIGLVLLKHGHCEHETEEEHDH